MTRAGSAADVALRAAFADELLERLASASAHRAAVRRLVSGGATAAASIALLLLAGRRRPR